MRAAGARADAGGAAAARRRTSPAKQHLDALRAAYATAGVDAEVLPFIDDMAARYAEGDLSSAAPARSRSASCRAAGVASVLVPFVASTTIAPARQRALLADARRGDPPAAGRADAAPARRRCWRR